MHGHVHSLRPWQVCCSSSAGRATSPDSAHGPRTVYGVAPISGLPGLGLLFFSVLLVLFVPCASAKFSSSPCHGGRPASSRPWYSLTLPSEAWDLAFWSFWALKQGRSLSGGLCSL